jgi:regulator of replication initiation timing
MTDQPPLIPREPRRMKQPRKELLRDAVEALTAENIRLRQENEHLRRPWWARLFWRKAA